MCSRHLCDRGRGDVSLELPTLDFARLIPCAELRGEDAEDDALLAEMLARARSYLSSFRWCRAIRACYVGEIAVGAVVLVVLFQIEPAEEQVDEWLWVVVGDLPPAYLVTDQAADVPAALTRYAEEMERWVSAVRAGEPADDLIPVQTAGGRHSLQATPEHAEDLARRLRQLRELFLDPDDDRFVQGD